MSRRTGLLIGLAGTLGLAAVALPATPLEVEVRLFGFRPGQLEVRAGTLVQWTNRDDITHTVTAGTPEAPLESFRLVLEGRGTMAAQTFTERGRFPYFCERHHHMQGTIRVQ